MGGFLYYKYLQNPPGAKWRPVGAKKQCKYHQKKNTWRKDTISRGVCSGQKGGIGGRLEAAAKPNIWQCGKGYLKIPLATLPIYFYWFKNCQFCQKMKK